MATNPKNWITAGIADKPNMYLGRKSRGFFVDECQGHFKTCRSPPALVSIGENAAYDTGSELSAGEKGLVDEGHSPPQSGWTGLRYIHWNCHAKNKNETTEAGAKNSNIAGIRDVTFTSKGQYRFPQ